MASGQGSARSQTDSFPHCSRLLAFLGFGIFPRTLNGTWIYTGLHDDDYAAFAQSNWSLSVDITMAWAYLCKSTVWTGYQVISKEHGSSILTKAPKCS